MVKILDRESINRMVGRRGSGGVGGGGGGSDIDLSGYATKSWTDENYVGKEFFSSLFKAYDANGNEVLPNDTETVIDNIKAMFGFWTEQYVSALGQGTGGGGGGVGDVTWDLLANNSDTRQIALSHLTTALSGYALTSQIPTNNNQLTNGAGYITSSALTGYATQTWANGQFLKLSGGTLTGDLTVESVEIGHTNEINALQSSNLYLQYRNNGNLILCYNGANVGIGAMTTPSYKLHVNGTFCASGDSIIGGSLDVNGNSIQVESASEPSLQFHIPNVNWGNLRLKANGEFYFYKTFEASSPATVNVGNLYSYGYVTALSDARHKTIISDAAISVEQIARMPAVVYQWNDGREDNGLHVGSIAQDWQRVLPEVVMRANDEEGTLSMQYGVAALVSSIITARKVVDHERRIAELERENKELKMKLKIA